MENIKCGNDPHGASSSACLYARGSRVISVLSVFHSPHFLRLIVQQDAGLLPSVLMFFICLSSIYSEGKKIQEQITSFLPLSLLVNHDDDHGHDDDGGKGP